MLLYWQIITLDQAQSRFPSQLCREVHLDECRLEGLQQTLPLAPLRELGGPGQEGLVAALGKGGGKQRGEAGQQGPEGLSGLHRPETPQQVCRIGLLAQVQHHQARPNLHRIDSVIRGS